MAISDESILIIRASKGDENAFEEIMKLYGSMIYNLAYQSVHNKEDALDISQETYIKAFRSIKKFRGECKLSSWLYKICRNTINDYLRKNQRHNHVSIDGDDEGEGHLELHGTDEATIPIYALEKKLRCEAVRKAISLLSSEHREIILLRDFEGYTYSEIAQILSIEEGTVKSRLNRARIQIKEFMIKGNLI